MKKKNKTNDTGHQHRETEKSS